SFPIKDEPIFGAGVCAAALPGSTATNASTPRPASTNSARIRFIPPSCPVLDVRLRNTSPQPPDAKYQRAQDLGQLHGFTFGLIVGTMASHNRSMVEKGRSDDSDPGERRAPIPDSGKLGEAAREMGIERRRRGCGRQPGSGVRL